MYSNWNELENECLNCRKCNLFTNRKNVVLGKGNKNDKIMFIGEGPGVDEDETGEIFIGKSGKLMNMALKGTGIDINNVYFTNVLKCRTPGNREPQVLEVEACLDYLRNEVILIKPKIIVLLGNVALKSIFGRNYNITDERGKWIEKNGILYMPTFHPAALLRDESKKILFWKDLKFVQEKIIEL